MAATQYCAVLAQCVAREDGGTLRSLLTVQPHSHFGGAKFAMSITKADARATGAVPPAWRPVAAAHLGCIAHMNANDMVEAHKQEVATLEAFLAILADSDNWLIPGLEALCLDSRGLAVKADRVVASRGGDPNGLLEALAQTLTQAFSYTFNHRAPLSRSRKVGALFVTNTLLKVYFKLNKLRLCGNLTKSVESPLFPPLDNFPLSQTVTYRFYLGRLHMFDDKYKLADTQLSWALTHCHKDSTANKRLILQNLIPVRLQLGYLPTDALLKKYDLEQFVGIAQAMRTGNIKLFQKCMDEHRLFFIRKGVYLLMEQLQTLVYRTLFKKLVLIAGTNKPKLDVFLIPLKALGVNMDYDELECILANLIFKKLVKGYLSHKHRALVLSAKNPFPVVTAALK